MSRLGYVKCEVSVRHSAVRCTGLGLKGEVQAGTIGVGPHKGRLKR